jgi:hypothetical protein
MIDPNGNEPEAEWIELYNHSNNDIKLSDYKIGDAETLGDLEGMYNFPPEAVIRSEEALVIADQSVEFEARYGFKPAFEVRDTDPEVPDMGIDQVWAGGSLSLNNSGDEVLLLSHSNVKLDLVSWGNSDYAFTPPVSIVPEGHSIERYPAEMDTNSAEDWRDQPVPSPGEVDRTPLPTKTPFPATATSIPKSTSTATPTKTNTPTPTGSPSPLDHLLISEVVNNPLEIDPLAEWIEIYNPLKESIDLSDYKIGDEESNGGAEGMLQFPSGAGISPEEKIVIAHAAEYFYQIYGYQPDFEMEDSDPGVADMLIYSPWADGNINLGNLGDEVLLLGPGDILMDALSWGTSNWAFDPPCPVVAEGRSLERYPVNVDTDTATDWRDQEFPNPE